MSTDTDVAPVILMSEPAVKRGLKTPFNKEGDRTIKLTWEIGEGDLMGETVTYSAELNVTHNKGRNANYRATLWQMHNVSATTLDGRNGLMIYTSFAGAARFKASALEEFANYALTELRRKINDPAVLAYFKPERVR